FAGARDDPALHAVTTLTLDEIAATDAGGYDIREILWLAQAGAGIGIGQFTGRHPRAILRAIAVIGDGDYPVGMGLGLLLGQELDEIHADGGGGRLGGGRGDAVAAQKGLQHRLERQRAERLGLVLAQRSGPADRVADLFVIGGVHGALASL